MLVYHSLPDGIYIYIYIYIHIYIYIYISFFSWLWSVRFLSFFPNSFSYGVLANIGSGAASEPQVPGRFRGRFREGSGSRQRRKF